MSRRKRRRLTIFARAIAHGSFLEAMAWKDLPFPPNPWRVEAERLRDDLDQLRALHLRQNENVVAFDRGRLHEMAGVAAVERIAQLESDVEWLRENNQLLARSAEHYRARFEAGK